MTDATFAIYRDREEIRIAVRSLIKLGFERSAVWVFQSKPGGSKDFSQVNRYQLKNCAIIGAIVGSISVGLLFMVLNRDSLANRMILPLIGVFIGALVGAASGALVGIGTPDPAAKRYGQYLQSGGILLSVQSGNAKQVHQAREALSATGGQDIQLINEMKTWDNANLERIDLENLEKEADGDAYALSIH